MSTAAGTAVSLPKCSPSSVNQCRFLARLPCFGLQLSKNIVSALKQTGPGFWPIIDVFLAMLVSLLRLLCGGWVAEGVENCERPKELLELYEFEGCPKARLVRETMSVLDLDYVCYPCPLESLADSSKPLNSRFRLEAQRISKSNSLPVFVDKNKDIVLSNVKEIVEYLWATYGAKAKKPMLYKAAHWEPYCEVSSLLCCLYRPCLDMGVLRAPSFKPEKPLEVWGYEPSPYVRRVREVLSMLEMPHVMHSVAKGSSKRAAYRKEELDKLTTFKDKPENVIQVPYIRDPNNDNLAMLESSDITSYLCTKYQTYPVASGSWLEGGADQSDFPNSTTAISVCLCLVMAPILCGCYLVTNLLTVGSASA